MFQFINRLGCFARKVFHCVGITQPVRALDRVIHVPLPVVRTHVGQRRGNTALRCHCVRTGRENLGDAGSAQTLFGHAKGRPKTGPTGTDNDHIIIMRFVFVCSHFLQFPGVEKAMCAMANKPAAAAAIRQTDGENDQHFFHRAVDIILQHHLCAFGEMPETNQHGQCRHDCREGSRVILQYNVIWLTKNRTECENKTMAQGSAKPPN